MITTKTKQSDNAGPSPLLLSPAQVAERLGVSRWTLYRCLPALRASGLVAVRMPGGKKRPRLRYLATSLDRLIQRAERTGSIG